jgi:hypothetical protein
VTQDPVPSKATFFHPASGAAILAVDWACFGLEWELGPFSEVVMCAAAFAVTYAIVWRVQSKLRGDAPRMAHAKAFAGALAAGVPFPVTGTVVGGTILALSGLKLPWK